MGAGTGNRPETAPLRRPTAEETGPAAATAEGYLRSQLWTKRETGEGAEGSGRSTGGAGSSDRGAATHPCAYGRTVSFRVSDILPCRRT